MLGVFGNTGNSSGVFLSFFSGLRQALNCITTVYVSYLNVCPPAIYSGKQEHLSCLSCDSLSYGKSKDLTGGMITI